MIICATRIWLFLVGDSIHHSPSHSPVHLFLSSSSSSSFLSLPATVLETLKSAVIQGESELLDDETRLVAFNFLKSTAPIGLMQDMTDVFELKQGIDVIEPVLREMLTHGLHKEVS